MRDGVVRQYVVEADQQEEYEVEQYGTFEDQGLARRVFARVHRAGEARAYVRRRGGRPFEESAFVFDAWGRRRSLSRLQVRVLEWLDARPVGARFSQRLVADSLGVNVSSISRTLALLEAFGLAHTDRQRGRYGGTRKVSIPPADLKARAKLAWKRIMRAKDNRTWAWVKWMSRTKYSPTFIRFFVKGPRRGLST